MPVLSSLEPVRIVEGGRLWLRGDGFPQPDSSADLVTIGGVPARMAFCAPDRIAVVVPQGLDGGETAVKVASVPGTTLYARVGGLMATGLHQVDNPVFGADGALYVTYSGTRGQDATVSIFRMTKACTPLATPMPPSNSATRPTSPRNLPSSSMDCRISLSFSATVWKVWSPTLSSISAFVLNWVRIRRPSLLGSSDSECD